MSVFAHAQDIKTVHAGGGWVKKWQNSVHVVVEWPLMRFPTSMEYKKPGHCHFDIQFVNWF